MCAIALVALIGCGEKEIPTPATNPLDDLIVKNEVLVSSFIGNGFQWGGYDILESWTGSSTLSESDWTKLLNRVEYMRPSLVRIMVGAGWNYLKDGEFYPQKSEAVLTRILDFCEAEGIAVKFGEWGHSGGTSIDQEWLEHSASFLEWLINTKNYTCIKYYCMVNEPNGSWSTINGNYNLWRQLIEQFHAKLVEKGIDGKVQIIGPDIAVWDTHLTWWVTNTYEHLGDKMGAYVIHTYPSEVEVRDGNYLNMLRAYRQSAPAAYPLIMGEVGFKYPASSELGIENARRIDNDPFASDDSNMFIYDAFYGIDMADAMIQSMLARYSGVIVWNLDDAMYNIDGGSSTLLKRWGFWNILGSEKFSNPDDENIRPWFYPLSLMMRYFPAGASILDMSIPSKKGLRAIACTKNGHYTIAIVNSHRVKYSLNLKMEDGQTITGAKSYKYIAGDGSSFEGNLCPDGFPEPFESNKTIDLADGKHLKIDLPGQSFVLLTNIPIP